MNNNDIPQSAIHDAKDRLRVSVIPFLASFTLLAPQLLGPQIARAEGEVATATPAALGAPPTDFILKYKDYYADCQQV